jgi:hypothetical protein
MIQKDTNKGLRLSEKQVIAIQALMRSRTYSEAAEAAGVSRVTLYRWLKDDLFNAELSKQKNELIKRSSRKLAGSLDLAVDVLIDLLKTKNPQIRRLTAVNLIEYSIKTNDITDIEKRIKALEETIK